MKKGIIIGGVVLVIGGVSYFLYMKEKKKEQGLIAENQTANENSGATTGTINTSIPINKEIPPLPTGGIVSFSTTLISIEEQNKLDKARDIYEKIKENKRFSEVQQGMIDRWKKRPSYNIEPLPNKFPSIISKLKDDLLQLGYEIKGESKPVLVKLNTL